MRWSAPGESKRGPRQRRSALGDLAQLDADDRERASCKSAQAHSEGAGNPRPNRCGGGVAHVRAWRGPVRASRMSKRRPELMLRRSTTRGSPAQGRPWSFGCSPSCRLRFKAAPCLRSCAAAHLTLKRRWTRSLIESRTLGPGELNSASRGVPSSRRPPGRHSA